MVTEPTCSGGRSRCVRLLAILVGAACAATFAGCGPKLKGVYEDPSFRSAEMRERAVAVGGIVWTAEPVERESEVCAVLEEILHKRLEKDLGTERVRSRPWLAAVLGETEWNRLLESLDERGFVDSMARLELIRAFRDSSALIVFGRVVADGFYTQSPVVEPGSDDGTEYVSVERRVSIALEVFDPVSGRDVWRALVSQTDVNTAQVESDSDLGDFLAGLAVAVVAGAIFDGEDQPEPPPVLTTEPKLADASWKIFGALSKALAGED